MKEKKCKPMVVPIKGYYLIFTVFTYIFIYIYFDDKTTTMQETNHPSYIKLNATSKEVLTTEENYIAFFVNTFLSVAIGGNF